MKKNVKWKDDFSKVLIPKLSSNYRMTHMNTGRTNTGSTGFSQEIAKLSQDNVKLSQDFAKIIIGKFFSHLNIFPQSCPLGGSEDYS